MTSRLFDNLARSIAQQFSRRAALGALGTTLAGLVALGRRPRAARAQGDPGQRTTAPATSLCTTPLVGCFDLDHDGVCHRYCHGIAGLVRGEVCPCQASDAAPACPIGWGPTAVTPVFFGRHEVAAAERAPGRLRLFYPSVGESPEDAPLLTGCGRYPLVLFLHGHCGEPSHAQAWTYLPSQLARSGYVVAVPQLPQLAAGIDPTEAERDLVLADETLAWLRASWSGRDALLPTTAVVGHAAGALLGGRLAATVPLAAYVSLSGPWLTGFAAPASVLAALDAPALFLWGNTVADRDATLAGTAGASAWRAVRPPKHRVRFAGAGPWDYLLDAETTCGAGAGSCRLVRSLAADVTALFLTKYVWPEASGDVPARIGNALVPPPLAHTAEQQRFAVGSLVGFKRLPTHRTCQVTTDWHVAGERGAIRV